MRRIAYIAIMLIFLGGCATALSRGIDANKKSLQSISFGMSKAEVLKIMGTAPIMTEGKMVSNPYRTDVLNGATKTYEVLYYVTNVDADDGMISDNELTPFVFYKGMLIGSGWDYMQTVR